MIGLFIFSISSWFSFGRLYLRICPFLPGCPFYWHRVACSSLLGCFDFCGVCCNFSFFISNFYWFESSPSFSWWVWLMVYQFCLSSQTTTFWFYWSLLLFSLFPFISALVFMISFLLLTLGFLCSCFSSSFRCKVRLFEIFLVSWGRLV